MCTFLCCVVIFVNMLVKRLAVKTILTGALHFLRRRVFPYTDQIYDFLIVIISFYVLPTYSIFNFLIVKFLTATYFSNARYSQFVLTVPLNPNRSISLFIVLYV